MTALAMTYPGAGGNTKKEIRSVMHLSDDEELIHDAFQDVISDMKVCNFYIVRFFAISIRKISMTLHTMKLLIVAA